MKGKMITNFLNESLTGKVRKLYLYSFHIGSLSLFRLNTIHKTSGLGSVFAQSKPKTIERAVLENNMDQYSFHNSLDSILDTMDKSKQAYFLNDRHIKNNHKMECQVIQRIENYH